MAGVVLVTHTIDLRSRSVSILYASNSEKMAPSHYYYHTTTNGERSPETRLRERGGREREGEKINNGIFASEWN